jgi:murein hydrolase activator
MGFSFVGIPLGNSRTSCRWRQRCLTLGRMAVLAALISQLWLTAAPGAETSSAGASESKDISSYRIKIRRLQQEILNKENQISETQSSEQNILAELENLDKKIAVQQEKLGVLEGKMQKQQALIDREENALTRIREEKGMVENHLKKRIAAYYTMGDIGLLNVTFSTQTLPELLTFHDAFDTLIKYDQDVIKVYRETINGIERTKVALDLERAVLENFIKETVGEKEILEKTKAEKHILLTQVRTQTKLHKQAKEEMHQAAEDLTQSIVAIKSQHQPNDQQFLADKGNLRPPVDGVIVTLFQQEKVNKLGISRLSQGIELQAPDGMHIVAVGEGEVIYASYLRGYGNTVIIHHGFQYYSVTSRIEKILVAKGQQVKREETIGIMGNTAALFDEGLYFEIRHGSQSLDPLLWLNPNRLKTLHEHSAALPEQGSSAQ